jgi:hypothetical protein
MASRKRFEAKVRPRFYLEAVPSYVMYTRLPPFFGSRLTCFINRFNESARLPEQIPQLLAFREGFAGIPAVFKCVLVTWSSTRACRTAVHPATLLPAHRRRHTWLPQARFGPTARAAQHRPGVSLMVGHADSGGASVPLPRSVVY